MSYIFMHGLGQNFSSWEKTISYLGENLDICCLDISQLLRGKEPNYSNLYDSFSEHCLKSTEAIGLCGLSLGAILSLHFTLDYPERVQSLVLIGAQYKIPRGLLKLQNIIFQLMPSSSFQKLGFSKSDFIKLSQSFINLDFSKQIADVRCRTLIVCGEKDKANKKAAQELLHHIQDAKACTIAGAGHEVNLDAPEKLAFMIREFWAENQSL